MDCPVKEAGIKNGFSVEKTCRDACTVITYLSSENRCPCETDIKVSGTGDISMEDRMQRQGEKKKYYVVRERAVPEVLLKVVEAKKLLDSGCIKKSP